MPTRQAAIKMAATEAVLCRCAPILGGMIVTLGKAQQGGNPVRVTFLRAISMFAVERRGTAHSLSETEELRESAVPTKRGDLEWVIPSQGELNVLLQYQPGYHPATPNLMAIEARFGPESQIEDLLVENLDVQVLSAD
jgi:hypothetical protein